MKRNRVGEIAKRKLRKFIQGEFVAMLTPSEALYLLEIGCKLKDTNNFQEKDVRTMVASGDCFVTHYYFDSVTVTHDIPSWKIDYRT